MFFKETRTVFHEVIEQVGDHVAHANRVDTNAMFYRFQGLGSGQLSQRPFRRGVGRDTRKCEVRGIGRNVDDGA
ncbi:hypothetical protein D3C72_1145880 [compost metagenome]